jgi:hypothetical protein
MVLGISIFGLLAASLAAYFIEQDTNREPGDRLNDIQVRLARIEQRLGEMHDRGSTEEQIEQSS